MHPAAETGTAPAAAGHPAGPGTPVETDVELRVVTKRYGSHPAVDALDLQVRRGEFLALLGPSGCGKTTCLRLVAGFERPDDGVVLVGGRDVSAVPPSRREVNTVFQSYALFGHLDVRRNVEFGLRQQGVPKAERRARAEEALALVRLEGFEGRRPRELSGGQQQRVALARALVLRPRVLLLDEPLGALDLQLRKQMQVELKRLHREIGCTFVFVTHDQGEALSMADRVAVMHAGRIEQLGTPADVYDRPATPFVASFVGDMNTVDGEVDGGAVRTPAGLLPAAPEVTGRVRFGLRPEALEVSTAGTGVAARLVEAAVVGDAVVVVVDVPGAGSWTARRPRREQAALLALRPGDEVGLRWEPADAVVLPVEAS